MWENSKIKLQSRTQTDTNGSIKNTFTAYKEINCDAQRIKDLKSLADYGYSDSNVGFNVFTTDSAISDGDIIGGYQCEYLGRQFWIVFRAKKYDINNSNHRYFIIKEVV